MKLNREREQAGRGFSRGKEGNGMNLNRKHRLTHRDKENETGNGNKQTDTLKISRYKENKGQLLWSVRLIIFQAIPVIGAVRITGVFGGKIAVLVVFIIII